MSELVHLDISHELWREYEWECETTGRRYVYRIDSPVSVFYPRRKHYTHRVVDQRGVAHCVPTLGLMGCVIRWMNQDGLPPVEF